MSRFATKITDGQHVSANQMIGLRLPDRNHLVGEYLLGVSEAESIKNRADPSNPLTVQGTGHVYNPYSAVLKSSLTVGYGFISNIIPDEHSSFIAVRKKPSLPTNTHAVGYNSTSNTATWGSRHFGAAWHTPMWEPGGNAGAPQAAPAGTGIYFQAGVSSILNPQTGLGGRATQYWYAAGVQQSSQSPTQAAVQTIRRTIIQDTRRFAIGSNTLPDSGTSTTFEIYFAAIYQKPLTAAEIETAYRAIVAYYATRGVTVI